MSPISLLLLVLNLLLLSHLTDTVKRHKIKQNSLQQTKHEHYIKTSECHIPYIPREIKNIKSISRNEKVCSPDESLISISFDEKTQQYVLHVNDSVAQLRLRALEDIPLSLGGYNCSYQEIQRVNQTYKAKEPVVLGEEVAFWDGYLVPRNVQGMTAACRNELAEELQTDTFALVQPKKSYTPLSSWHRRPSVLMIGIDGISQNNFHSNMPRIFNYLKTNGWFSMDGYTRVGKDTLPNLMAMLTGYSPHTWSNLKCQSERQLGCLKTIPLLWKRFKKKGYITAYGEGMSDLTMFNVDKFGFSENSIDFYARPYLELKKRQDCIDRRLNMRYILDFCEDFVKQHKNISRPLFGLCFSISISPERSYANDRMQTELLEKLEKFKKMNVLSQYIVILFSDQGSLEKGKNKDFIEKSLPILYIWLPTWFRLRHPEIVQALRINSKRLTSPYDLHLTLQHLLELGERWPRAVDKLVDCPTCQTLFAPIPENRTCSDAGIGETYCPCDSYKMLNNKQVKQLPLGKLLIRSINSFLNHNNLRELCSKLSLNSIKTVLQRKDVKFTNGSTYRVEFTAKPNNLRFSATTRYNHKNQVLEYLNVESINRLNNYQNDSNCMRRLRGRKFCVCKKRIVKAKTKSKVKVKEKLLKNKIWKKVDDSLYKLPDMQPENNQNIEIISV
ncbi:LOW QUALITY PROTEIN: uncharacterized protein LOC108110642 [Drosophila eugracilis]|uniref:LOW QUALITY PROTEIN: uncharacterized protein LOC108110642 n=1 Tax=Drosophila eugracilis TaxID=29029 RepID=UPI001BDB48E8|nr:LOW QUALITY PROTEIN: uncharacterized protein LOC108110642 [Drosophila eugracilis]